MPAPSRACDRGIRTGLRSGDAAVLETIWDGYAADLFGLLMSMLRSKTDAEDALQDVFVKIARNRRTVARARNLRLYLLRMARNEALTLIDRRRRESARLVEFDPWLAPVGPAPGAGQDSELLEDALRKLPEEQRTVLTLKVYQDMTFREIGRLLGISGNTAASRFRYGLHKLRVFLREAST